MFRLLTASIFSLCASVGSAQSDSTAAATTSTVKVGHVNSGLVLESMPGVANADTLLSKYQDTLRVQFTKLETELQTLVDSVRGAQENLTPKQLQAAEQRAGELQQEMQVFQQEGARMFEVRRETYLGPILEKVQAQITAYAKTNGFSMIFDSSVPGVLVFAQESQDLTEKIIAELEGAKP